MMNGNTWQLEDTVSVQSINAQSVMQLATCQNNEPWNCSVYFVVYNACFYWLSLPNRRHSRNIDANPSAAIAVVLQSSQPVVGVQAEGSVHVIEDIDEAEKVLALYIEKYNQGNQFAALLRAGKNNHCLYRLTPNRVMLFDERDTAAAGISKELTLI